MGKVSCRKVCGGKARIKLERKMTDFLVKLGSVRVLTDMIMSVALFYMHRRAIKSFE